MALFESGLVRVASDPGRDQPPFAVSSGPLSGVAGPSVRPVWSLLWCELRRWGAGTRVGSPLCV